MTDTPDDSEVQRPVDPFLRRYLVVMGLLVLAAVAYWVANADERVSELNKTALPGLPEAGEAEANEEEDHAEDERHCVVDFPGGSPVF